MNKKISCFSTSLLTVSMALLVSCEWEGSNSDSSFNSAGFSWVNFSGVYRAVGGGVLVSAFTSGTTPGTPSSTNSVTGESIGSSGAAIFQFTMFHAGNKIELTDNTGAKYTGKFGKLQTTGGIDSTSGGTTGPSPAVGDSVVGEFTAKGVSSAGVSVMIVGTFQGVVSGGADGLFLSNRLMLGSWIEPGIQGNINGQAAPIGIATTN